MTELRYGWLSESRRVVLRSLISGEVLQWSRDWCIGQSAAQVDVRASELFADDGQETCWRGWDSASGAMTFLLSADTEVSWGRYMAALSDGDDSGLAASLGAESLQDLSGRLLQRAGIRETIELVDLSPGRALLAEGFGAYAVTIEVGEVSWHMLVDRRLADRLAPPEKAKSIPLASRDLAVGNTKVPVSAVMAFGSVSLSAITGLRVGEILVGDSELDRPVEIRVGQRGSIAAGSLKQQAQKRAITLTGLYTKE
jgi:hypothetical protein